ncbi:hypothetical protein FGO68_gene7424 [Halteria grandinella]|uniref:UDP-N-acetylglucosamine--peptide N-acetylglucosaminyltransferase SPINDLY n=1 Tax=Halteria grandinella TaxID=5974 RepID=A0A8J8T8X7_HALGN|nr:hypothetical protein FGO68_gene7424 [Halteria grandinella]
MFKEKAYDRAESIYRLILEREPQNVDAINSLASCLRAKAGSAILDQSTFGQISSLYQEALRLDRDDVEANFNLALLYLQSHPQGSPDFGQALHYLMQSIKKDKQTASDSGVDDLDSSFQVLMKPQFAKACYNIAMLHDRLGDIQKASAYYKSALDKFPDQQNVPPFYSKVLTNYAVTLEKLGKREEAMGVLEMSGAWEGEEDEVRVYNNKGIIQKRKGDLKEAMASYQAAIDIDGDSFFPHYNLGVLKAQMKDYHGAIVCFQRALQLAKSLQESVYQINVHLNLAMLLERTGDAASALREYQIAHGLDPSNQKIKAKIQALTPPPLSSNLSQHTSDFATEQNALVKGAIEEQKKRGQQAAIKQASVNKRLSDVRLSQPKKLTGSQDFSQPAKNTSYGSSKKFINQNLLPALEVQKRNAESKNNSVVLNNSTAKHIHKLGDTVVKEVNPVVLDDETVERMSAKEVNQVMEDAESVKNMKELEQDNSLEEVKVADITIPKSNISDNYSNPYGELPPTTIENLTASQRQEHYATTTDQQRSGLLSQYDNRSGAGVVQRPLTGQVQDGKSLIIPDLLGSSSKHVNIEQKGEANPIIVVKDEREVTFEQQSERSNHRSPLRSKAPSSNHIQSSHYTQQDDFLDWTEQVCRDKLARDPNDKKALFRLGTLLIENKTHTEEGISFLESLDPTFNPYKRYLRLGEAYYRLDNCDKALSYLDKASSQAASSDEDVCALELARGKCLDRLKRFQEAIGAYQSALVVAVGQANTLLTQANLHFRLGWVYVRSRISVEQGIEHLRKSHRLLDTLPEATETQHQEVLSKLASVLFREQPVQGLDEALDLARKSLRLNPMDADTQLLLGKILDKKGLHTEAVEAINISIKLQSGDQPPRANVFFHLGGVYERAKDFKKAVLNYKKCLTLDTKHFGACLHLANLLANVGEGQRAAKYFKHAIKVGGESEQAVGKESIVNAYFGLGKTLQQYSDNKDAPLAPLLKVVQELDPSHYKAHTQLGLLFMEREEYERAADHLKQALLLNRGYPLALVTMGNLLFETGHADEAIRYHKQALSVNEKELQALIGLGNAYYDTQRPHEAVHFYRKALEQDQQLADVHYNLGNALYLVEDIQGAIDHYRSAISLNPKKAESHYNLGNALCVKQDYPAAIAAYQAALEIDPRNAPALYNLGNAFYMVNRFEEAVKVYIKALDINEKSAECHFNLASAYNDLSDHARAVHHYTRSIELDEGNVDAYVCLANVLEGNRGSQEKIEALYREALARDPENQKAKEGMKKLKRRI